MRPAVSLMRSMIYLQAIVSSKDAGNIGTAIVKDQDTGLSYKYNFCTNYTPGGEPTDCVNHQLLLVDDLGDDLSNPKKLPSLANISSKALKSILEYMEVDGANNISKNVVFSEEYGIMWRKDIQVESDKYLDRAPGGRAETARMKTENRLIEAAKQNSNNGYAKPKRLKGYNIQIVKPYDFATRNTIESDEYDRDAVFNARYAESENIQKLRKSLDKAKHSSESKFVYDVYGEPRAFKVSKSYDPFPVPNGFREDVNLFDIPESNREYIPEVAYKEALIPDFQSVSVEPVDIEDLDDRVHTRYYAFLGSWDECKILHRIVLRTVKEVHNNRIDVKSEELVIDNLTLVKILQNISIKKGVPDNSIPPVTVNSLYGPMWLHKKTCFVDDKSIGDYTKRAAEAFSNRYEDITKYYEASTLAENNNKALEAAIQIRQWMVDPPTSCDKYNVSNRLIDNFARELLPFNHYYKHTDIFNKNLGKSGIKKVLGYTANKRILEFGRLKAAEQAAKQNVEQAVETQASGTPEKGTAIVRYVNNDGATTKYEIQFEDLSLETLTIRDLAKNIITGKMEIENIKIKEDNGRKKLVCTSSDIETMKDK